MIQVPLNIIRQRSRAAVTPLAIMLQRLERDPVEVASQPADWANSGRRSESRRQPSIPAVCSLTSDL
jgi:hypothetical protein